MLVSQGVIQTLDGSQAFDTIAGGSQTLALGPVASQEAIKELGTNGGGFFNVNSAMPFENPSGFTNFIELMLILIIPASLTYTFGRMIGNRRQGWALYGAMMAMFIVAVAVVYIAEQHGSPAQHHAGVMHRMPSTAPPAATWRARSNASASPRRRCGRRSPPSPPAAPSTARWTR